MDHEISHGLSQARALGLVHEAVAAYEQRFAKHALEVSWVGAERVEFAFTVRGLRLHGALDIEPGKFRLHLTEPLLLRPFRRRAIERIEAEVASWLARASAGQG